MITFKSGLMTLIALATAAHLAAAGTPEPRVDQLRAAQDRVARAADRTKGGPRHLLLQEQRRLGRIIDDLETGKAVDPAEIDRALQDAERGTW
jgi:hypothetical protein